MYIPDKRFTTGLILAIVLISSIFWLPRILVAIVISLLIGIGLWEFYNIAMAKGYKPFRMYGTVLGVLLVLVSYFLVSSGKQADEIIYIALFLIIVVVLVRHSFVKDDSSVIINSAVTLLGIMYIGFLFTFFIKLRYLPNSDIGKGYIMALFIITKMSDICAYICGSRWGKHKLIPRISAKKTIEGSVFGVLGAVFASMICRLWFLDGINWYALIGLGILLGVIGQIGDLVESLIKRDAQIKDSGKLIPGLGGVLDFMDSLLFTGPVMYIYLKIILI